MNPNLTPLQRAARNLFAAEIGNADPATIELMFLNPVIANLATEMAQNLLDGPFGTFVPAPELGQDHVVKSPNHQEGFEAGYGLALQEVIEMIESIVTPAPSVEAGLFLIEQMVKLQQQIRARIDGTEQLELPLAAEPDCATGGINELAAWLRQITGRDIQVVRL